MGADPATTMLLRRASAGDPRASEELLPLVYGELHRLALSFLQPTALIHEAWMRLIGDPSPQWNDRAHFVALAARAMRQVLVDHARRRDADKRGGGAVREPLDAALELFEERSTNLLDLDSVLEKLRGLDPQLARIVELRFFGGASNEEIASALGTSTRTVERGWKLAQAWLRSELERLT
jgi:RNA polymerase sigma factor (TIGR02999 family)